MKGSTLDRVQDGVGVHVGPASSRCPSVYVWVQGSETSFTRPGLHTTARARPSLRCEVVVVRRLGSLVVSHKSSSNQLWRTSEVIFLSLSFFGLLLLFWVHEGAVREVVS